LKYTKEKILSDLKEENIIYYKDCIIVDIIDRILYDFTNNKKYYLNSYKTDFRSNQSIIYYIFQKGVDKIKKNNIFTPYFYNLLLLLNINNYCDEIENDKTLEIIDSNMYDEIINFKYKTKLPRSLNKDIDHTKYICYKNGLKFNEKYYKFNFDFNITKDNIYDILKKIDNEENLINFILFEDINDKYSYIKIEKINSYYDWHIHEYDGNENVIQKLPYKKIIEDLLNKLWKTENYINSSILTDTLVDKTKTLKELNHDMNYS
jgi:hypothetical protein